MARILGNLFGELRGKMGGLVFSRNKAGQFVRQYVKPVDANTPAQVDARAAFAQAGSAFHSLDPSDKQAWNVFAASYFTSKRLGNVPSIHSGVNAFISLRSTMINMSRTQSQAGDLAIKVNNVAATAITQSTITAPLAAPVSPMVASLDFGSYSISDVISVNYDVNTQIASFSFNIIYNSTPTAPAGTPTTSTIFTDEAGAGYGFAVYASNLLVQKGTFVANPGIVLLGNTGLIEGYTMTLASVPAIVEMSFTSAQDFSNYRKAVIQGGEYRFTLYMYNSQGQTIKIGENTGQAN